MDPDPLHFSLLPLIKKTEHSSSNRGWWCCNSCRPRLFSWGFIFSLMVSQVLFMSSLSLKFSKAANLFEISIWYCFLTSSSFSFLRLNLFPSNFCVTCLLNPQLLQPPDSDQYHNQLPWNFVHLVCSTAICCLSICDHSGCECSH